MTEFILLTRLPSEATLTPVSKGGNINKEQLSVLLVLREKKVTRERCWGNWSRFTSLL